MEAFSLITKCRACGFEYLMPVLSLGSQKVVSFRNEVPPAVPLELVLCSNCNLLQLKHTTRPDLLWGEEYGYRSGVNQTMKNELTEIVRSVEDIVPLFADDVVLDIGCNDGTLLSAYSQPCIKVGFDPSANVAKYAQEAGHEVIVDYFNADSFPYGKAKVVTAISMFYDLDNPNQFIKDILRALHPSGVLVIQQNYLLSMLEQTAFDNICHEHLEYYCLMSLEPLLARYNLEVFDVTTNAINGGSFRTYIRYKNGAVYSSEGRQRVDALRSREIKAGLDDPLTYKRFSWRVKHACNELARSVKALSAQGANIFAYGASTRGGTLLQSCGLDNKQITAVADRNPDKWGKTMQTTGLPIVSEAFARKHANYFLVLPWFFRDEFTERESAFRKKGGKLIFPLPRLEVE